MISTTGSSQSGSNIAACSLHKLGRHVFGTIDTFGTTFNSGVTLFTIPVEFRPIDNGHVDGAVVLIQDGGQISGQRSSVRIRDISLVAKGVVLNGSLGHFSWISKS